MATETKRQDFGMTDKGAVVVISLNNSADDGSPVESFMVRHGVRTVGTYDSEAKAERVAKALTA